MARVFFVLFLLTLSHAGAQTAQDAINRFVSDKNLKQAGVSIALTELDKTTIIAAHNPQLALSTASTAKLYATATALEILGPDYKPKTRIYTSGTIDQEGVLHGDLLIRGGGDPSLGSSYFTENGHQTDFLLAWSKAISDAGIKKITGSVIADGSEFGYAGVPDGWAWGDIGNYYGAGPAGICVYDNLVRLTFAVPGEIGMRARLLSMSPEIPEYKLENGILSSARKGDNAYIYGAPYSYNRFSRGTLPAGTTYTIKGSMPDPELFLAQEVNRALKELGIHAGEEPSGGRLQHFNSSESTYAACRLILTHEGVSIRELITETNFRSINLFAEQLLCLVAYNQQHTGSTEMGLEVMTHYWRERIGTDGLLLTDGSGLSRSNAVSAAQFNALLAYMYRSKNATTFRQSLPTSGTSGTLSSLCDGEAAQGKYTAKSGSMNKIRSYAGYLNIRGKDHVFSIVVNNQTGTSGELVRNIENLLNQLVQ